MLFRSILTTRYSDQLTWFLSAIMMQGLAYIASRF